MLLLVAVFGCASGNSCVDYVAALQACSDEAGGTDVYDGDAICGEWTADQEELYGDWYKCQMSAYTAQECKTNAELQEAESGAATCPQPTGS